ncbi:MAG: AMP-binding protein [Candidatus Competibacteraceae bacterium]|nr:AMP-binding protein [Candidatus Competibacteraceae bacterium]
MASLNVPIVPVHVSQLWGRLYQFDEGKFTWCKTPYKPYPIFVNFGDAMPPSATEAEVKNAIALLGVASYTARPLPYALLHHGFIRAARRNRKRMAIADATSGELNYFKTLAGSIVFARKLKKLLDKQPMTGVIVPPSVGGVLTNVALQMLGRVPINLNYTASNDAIASCARQCELTQTITAKRVLERLPIEVPGKTIFLEDVKDSITKKDQVTGALLALFAPIWLIERILGTPRRSPDDLATIIFSSGSEGEPRASC